MDGETGAGSNERWRRLAIFAAFVLIGLWVLFATAWALRSLILLTFLSVLFAVLLRSAANKLSDKTPLPPGWSVLAVLLILVVLIVLAVVLVVPTLVQQGTELVRNFPGFLDAAQKRISDTPFLSNAFDQVRQQFDLPSPSAALSQVGNVLSYVSSSVSNLVFILFATIFLALSPDTYVHGLRWLVPSDHRGFTLRLLDELAVTLRHWFAGQLVMMVMVGALAWLGLWAIGVPYSLALGVFAGLLDFVPYLGPILGAAPAIIVAFSGSPSMGLYAVILFVIVQQLEGNIVGPMVQQSAVAIPPALLLVFLFGMSQLFGLSGLLVATPLLAVVIVVVKRIYVERILAGIDKAGQASD